jgi:predicted RNase H-like nuclease
MRHNKKTDEGFRERLALLVERYAEAEWVLGSILLHAGKRVARDDAVDAFAAALTGLGPGPLRTIPEMPARDAAGIPMEMVFAG